LFIDEIGDITYERDDSGVYFINGSITSNTAISVTSSTIGDVKNVSAQAESGFGDLNVFDGTGTPTDQLDIYISIRIYPPQP